MKTTALRIYGENDLRLETFELPAMRDDEIVASVVADSLCMSSYKAAIQGPNHKRVPRDVHQNPTIIGHEFCGEIIHVGKKWAGRFASGQRYAIQPALNYPDRPDAIGYTYRTIGGNATYIVIPNEVIERGCLLPYHGDAFFYGSLAEPLSCVASAFHSNYHTEKCVYAHKMGIVEGGKVAILAGVGPMGLAAIDYCVHCERRPKLLVVTDIDDARLARAQCVLTPAEAKRFGVDLHYVNTAKAPDPVAALRAFTGGMGFDDVFVFAPVPAVFQQGDGILGFDGCMNFFAGPSDQKLSAFINLYNIHYSATHVMGSTGANTADMEECIAMMEKGLLNPAILVTHIGGLTAAREATLHLPTIPGGKKLIYNFLDLELTALEDFPERGKTNPLFARLAQIVSANQGLWCSEAERFLLEHAPRIG